MARSLRSKIAAGSFALVVATSSLVTLAAPKGGHGEDGHGHAAAGGHGEAGGGHHGDPHPNWFHGLLGEKEGVEPSLLWRAPGTPPPYLSNVINTLALAFVLVKLAKGPVVNGLRTRRERLLKGIDEASRMKAEAEKSLAEYKQRLDNIDSEITRVREEMRAANEAERVRILSDAEQRRTRLESEARLLVEQELAALHDQLRRETAAAALRSAREILRSQTTNEDQRRLSESFLQDLRLRAQAGARPSNGGASNGGGHS
jgi:F-type H+-transporting ATPase subunit b